MHASPAETPPEAPTEPLKGFSGVYRSAGRRARNASILLGVVAFVTLLSMIQNGSGLRIVDDARAGMLTAKEATNFNRSSVFVGLMYLAAVGACAIAFLGWLSRSVDNVPALGGGRPSVTPRWSIGWWFIPFVNLVKPYQIVRDVHDRMGIGPSSGGGSLLLAWWVSSILGNAIGTFAWRLPEPKNLDALAFLYSIKGTADALTFLGAVLAIFVVLRIQWRAEARA